MITYYKQTDPRWRKNRLGLSWLTVGAYGCVATCISMIATYIGSAMTPAQVASNKSWFIMGLINWRAIKIPHLKFVRREYRRNDKNIIKAIKDSPNTFVILQVKTKTIPQHWVWAIGVNGPSYWIADPLHGDKADLFSRYGHSITGVAYFEKI